MIVWKIENIFKNFSKFDDREKFHILKNVPKNIYDDFRYSPHEPILRISKCCLWKYLIIFWNVYKTQTFFHSLQ